MFDIPEVRLNLISVGRLDDKGYTSSIRNDVMKFYKGSLIVARARKTNTIYLMHARLCHNELNVAAYTAGELWHKRLCHMSEKGMQKLSADDLISEVKTVHLDTCADCLVGRKNRTSFPSRPPNQAESMLDQIEKKSIRSKSNTNQLTDLILKKIENRLKNWGNRPHKELSPTRTKKSKKNRPCQMKVEDIHLERGEPPEDSRMKSVYC